MIVLGLTGSIGMGKSTVLRMFAEQGAATWSADDAVSRLYAKGGAAVEKIAALVPSAIADGAVDRSVLAELVLRDPALLSRIEAVVHPLVADDRASFLESARKNRASAAVLDIPLLFETGAEQAFDAVVVVSAPEEIQRARVLARPGMTPEKLEALLARQMPDAKKRRRADYVIDTGGGHETTRAEVGRILVDVSARNPGPSGGART
jgi:dephospho-CoA kinase